MVQLQTLVLPALSLIASAWASNVQDLTPTNFDSIAVAGKPALVEFFAPWCGHCKRLAPIYEELADSFATNKNVVIAKVDGDEHKSLSTKFGISGFPTIKFFDGKSKDGVDYSGGRDLESLQNFITEKTSARPKRAAVAPSEVQLYDDSTFDGAIGKDKGVFVAFTAPWCGHCKTLAPTWEKLAIDYAPDSASVIIAKVDAEANKAIATAQGVSSFPTIKYFPAGSTKAVDYSGGRDEKDLLAFVNEKTGLHRAIGGGLDAQAGTVKALDDIAITLTGANLADVTKALKKAAQGAKDKYAEYYLKVADKLADNKAYLTKESSRLEGLLQKGGLARPKEDDLTSRLNILRQFLAGEKSAEDVKNEL